MLSDAKIRSLKIEDGKRHADRDGLVLEIRPSGKKVFLFRFQWEKKPQTITIGNYPSISLAEARTLAISHRDLLNKGIDPRKSDTFEIKKTTFREIAEQWHKKNNTRWKPVTSNRHHKSLIRDVYPFIGDKHLDDITKADILEIICPHEIRGHFEVTHRLHDRLEAIFEYAVGSSLTENYPFIGLKKALAPKPRVTNQPAINHEKAHEMLNIIKNSSATKIIKLYIELLAHLFTRPSELRLAQWSEFNLQKAEWHIPADRMKMAAPHWVPLSEQVLKLLKELRLITGFTPFLFNSPSTKKPQPISETSARKLIHNTGYKDLHTLHGFRALASSVLHEQSHFRSDAIEAQLAHKVQGVRGVYLRADFKTERRELMNWYSNWILDEQNTKQLKQETI
ncbi:tyrosine-type recombinase/integrase [Legionella bononiensis]|uniref:Integrase arm-type DNA-binding domain-containing protein n=1 Tax=Legionella bononiensis TaxID=2793102 RepID=A0ABS1W802_9GAMM|nr:integrase arm-type DNA-binding domain-containing protein [Legionella bononiensis]MBL7479990.1 integrase arm-type DNA-binding domain-containing protein [Legionella bononiensis]MBL7525496.1 integrase arm-type DNA-binding domain-containing protein [Legionella bononiensis]MBL7561679.1 integrase arm-type DNA-binding domain-containing protein [Legionella bononiensis]